MRRATKDRIDPITGNVSSTFVGVRGPMPQVVQLLAPRRVEPPKAWSEDWADMIARYKGAGLSNEQCAELAGVNVDFLEKHFNHELTNGKQLTVAKMAGKLIQKGLDGDNACLIFYLKTQGLWRETQRFEHTGADGRPIATMGVTIDASDLDDDQRAVLRLALERAVKAETDRGD